MDRIDAYLASLLPTSPVQARMEEEAGRRGFPAIGPVVGRLVGWLARQVDARSVFEMGSGFGYSALHFLEHTDAHVTLTDGDQGLLDEASRWLTEAGHAARFTCLQGDALDLLSGTHDVVFIDVDKPAYPAAFAAARRHVRKGGLILVDNALWKGTVAGIGHDDWTDAVRSMVESAFADPGLSCFLSPIRDGVLVARVN